MEELKKVGFNLIEIFVNLLIGFFFTIYILKPIYENVGIQFIGDIWINWFGVAYVFFVSYTLIFGLTIFKKSILFKRRRTSIPFWILFIVANYIVFIPFIKGENPF